MVTAVAIQPALWQSVRIWLEDCGSSFETRVRVEWQTKHGPASSVAKATLEERRRHGYRSMRVTSLDWMLDVPPSDVVEALVRELLVERDQIAHGCFAGYETSSEMYDAAEEGERYAAWRDAMTPSPEVALANALLSNIYPKVQ